MRTICILAFITLIALIAAPAFAEWTEAIEAPPVKTLSLGKEISRAPVEVADNSTAEIAEQAKEHAQSAEPPHVYTTHAHDAPPVETVVDTHLDAPQPSYMKVYKTANDLKPPSMVMVLSPNNPNAVPEPGSIVALSTGLGGLLLKLRRRRK